MHWLINQSVVSNEEVGFISRLIMMDSQPPAPSDDFDDICSPFGIDRFTQLGRLFFESFHFN